MFRRQVIFPSGFPRPHQYQRRYGKEALPDGVIRVEGRNMVADVFLHSIALYFLPLPLEEDSGEGSVFLLPLLKHTWRMPASADDQFPRLGSFFPKAQQVENLQYKPTRNPWIDD